MRKKKGGKKQAGKLRALPVKGHATKPGKEKHVSQKNIIKDSSLKKKIIQFLKAKHNAQKTIAIARGVGYTTAKEVNPTLYSLANKKCVTKVTEQPPTWQLDNQHFHSFEINDNDEEMQEACFKSKKSGKEIGSTSQQVSDQSSPEQNLRQVNLFGTHGESLFDSNVVEQKDDSEIGNLEPDGNEVEASLEKFHLEGENEQDLVSDDDDEEVTLQARLIDVMAYGHGNVDSSLYESSSDGDFSGHVTNKSYQEELFGKQLSSSVNLSFEDMVLQTLANQFLATAAAFVLANKIQDASKEDVETALRHLKEKNLVSCKGIAWEVTKTGEDYLRSKQLISDSKSPSMNVNKNNLIPRNLPSEDGRGVPLSPSELVTSGAMFCNPVPRGRGLNLQKAIEIKYNLSMGRGHGVLGVSGNSLAPPFLKYGGSLAVRSQRSAEENKSSSGIQTSSLSDIISDSSFHSGPSMVKPVAQSGFHIPPSPVAIVCQSSSSVNPPYVATASFIRSSATPSFSTSAVSSPMQLTASGSNREPARGAANIGISSESFAALNKNPVSALMEYAQSRHLAASIDVLSQRGPPHKPSFEIAAFVGNRQFPSVVCNNKKTGRKDAADVAMRTLIAEGAYKVTSNLQSLVDVPSKNMTHFDKMAGLVHQAFNALIASIPEALSGRKIIAGLVMKRNENDVGVVISIGSGNRCITGQQLSLEGNTINDSHAEIITRRGFMRFLYKQLESYDPSQPHGLFEKGSGGKLRIRPNITFHLYISTAPCGDGALFSPRDAGSNNAPLFSLDTRKHNPTFTSTVQGLLRTKMEGGEGTIPIESDFTGQTFDGIVRGERLRTMSCTDKICRWNVVGMQGALLSNFLEPIYLDSLTLGFLYDHGHLARAVCCRVNRTGQPIDEILPKGYHLNHPWLGRVTACDPSRETQKTKNLSINWSFGDQHPEVVDGPLGLCHTGIEKKIFSRMTKKNMYENFKKICGRFNHKDLSQAPNYYKAKMAAKDFQAAKQAFYKKLKENNYGPWVSKPVEEEMFS